MIQFGNDKIKEIYHGSDKIKEVYHGSELVYTAHDPRGYWVHKDTGVITYFDADADFITDGIMSAPSWKSDCSEVQIPSGVIGLGEGCFAECENLISITLPESVTSLGDSCFEGCESLTSITLPESITSLGDFCFDYCLSLTSITIPESVTSLGEYCSLSAHLSSLLYQKCYKFRDVCSLGANLLHQLRMANLTWMNVSLGAHSHQSL